MQIYTCGQTHLTLDTEAILMVNGSVKCLMMTKKT